jgi:protein FAM50
MYIKEDLIIPHHYTFCTSFSFLLFSHRTVLMRGDLVDDFIINQYRGKSGPMFSFDAHDDVRLLADASIEKDEVIPFLSLDESRALTWME